MQKRGPAIWLFVIIFTIAMPSLASAQVVINEIMYNPLGSDSGREWIELYNEGQNDVSMVGGTVKGSWRISDGSNHTLTDPSGGTGRGSLTIPAGGYLIIANDPTDFISGEFAGGNYSVVKSSISLNNSGSTISLLDGTGATVDTVSYSPSQGGSDDGSSLQKQSDGSWIAALPTPGAANSTVSYVPPPPQQTSSGGSQTGDTTDQSDASSSGQTSATQASPELSYVPPPTPDVFADAGSDRTVIVGADVEFDGSAYDKDQDLLDPSTTRFIWNFGDGGTAEGAAVLHHFSYPGTYAVILDIASDKNSASDMITVTAEPAALSFSRLSDGGVQIQDLAGHDLDLSGWVIHADATAYAAQLMLPEHTEILSGSSLNIDAATLTFRASSSTMLEYPNGALALAMGQTSATSTVQNGSTEASVGPVPSVTDTNVASPSPTTQTAPSPAASISGSNTEDISPSEGTNVDDAGPISDADDATSSGQQTDTSFASTSTILETGAVSSAPAARYLWWFGVVALAFAAVAAVAAAAHFKKGEWDIVEETSE